MKIGILSDTHNNLQNLQAGLQQMQARGVETVIHCGDLTGLEAARLLTGFRVVCTFGNCDIVSGEIRDVLKAQDPENYAGLVYRGEIGGVSIAATHGHLDGQLDSLLKSGEHQYVFTGHSHVRKDTLVGSTRLINPGSLGGRHVQTRSVCILDLTTGSAEFLDIAA